MEYVLPAALSVLFGAIALLRLPMIWRGQGIEAIDASLAPIWPFGDASRRGAIRAIPVAILGILAAIIADALGLVGRAEEFRPGDPITPAIGGMWFFVLVFFAAVLCTVSIILFNKPRLLVPPPLRSESGAVSRQIGSNSGRRRLSRFAVKTTTILAVIGLAATLGYFGGRRPSISTWDLLQSVAPDSGVAGVAHWQLAVRTGPITDCGLGLSGDGGLWQSVDEQVQVELHIGACAGTVPLWTRVSNWISSPRSAAIDPQGSASNDFQVPSLNADTVQAACVNGSDRSCYDWVVLLSYGQYALIVELDGSAYISQESFVDAVRFVDLQASRSLLR